MKIDKNRKSVILVFVLFTSLLAAAGQTLFKLAFLDTAFLALLIVVGLALYVVSTVYYLFVLSKVHLSWLYGLGGLSYVFAVLMAYFFLGESVPALRWVGVLIIFIGVILVGLS
jgi:uncharacterized membrane protein